MPHLANKDTAAVQALVAELATVVEAAPPTLSWLVPALRTVLGAEKAMALVYAPRADGLCLDEAHGCGLPSRALAAGDQWLADKTVGWTSFHPMRPEPAQRNSVMTYDDLSRLSGTSYKALPIYGVYSRFGLGSDQQLRVLLCEGPSLLAWIGVLQADAIEPQQRLLLSRLVAPMRRRLAIDRLLRDGGAARAMLDAAFEEISAPAFVLGTDRAMLEANSAGKAWLSRDRKTHTQALREAVRGRTDQGRFRVTKVVSPGVATRFLVVYRGDDATVHASRSAAAHWGFTPREVQVLVLVTEGLTNRTIAAQLAVAERTVETHLTSMFSKAQVETRSELIVRALRTMTR